jgi:glycosyltransferase involved in cell wall biosynthesis
MRLSIIVPAYNEERTIKAMLKRLDEVRQPDWQIIVVDDGSKDNTRNILKETSSI